MRISAATQRTTILQRRAAVESTDVPAAGSERDEEQVAIQPASNARRQLRIRKASPQDAAVVAEITDSAYEIYVPLLGRKPQPMTADHRQMIIENDVWLLEEEGHPLGVLELVHEPVAC